MTEGNPSGRMIRFAAPLVLGNVVEMIRALTDSVLLGRFAGVGAFAAVGASAFVYWMGYCVGAGMVSGFAGVFAQRIGAGDARGLGACVVTAMWLTAGFSLAVSALGVFGAGPLLHLLDTPAAIVGEARVYLQIRFAAMLVTLSGDLACAIFYAGGDSRTPFIVKAFSAGVHVVLDALLVLAVPLGAMGVALASMGAQLFVCAALLVRLRKTA